MDMESVHSVGSKDSGRKQTYDHGDQTGYPDDVKYEGCVWSECSQIKYETRIFDDDCQAKHVYKLSSQCVS